MDSTKTQTPKVKWAQRKDKLFITIDAINIKDPKIDIIDNQTLKFSGKGEENVNFAFELELYDQVNKDESKYNLDTRNILLNIKKQTKGPYWPRLTKKSEKLNFLSPDWQLYIDEDEEDDDSKVPKFGNEQGK
jgi:prostaglandin-E synthase